MNKIQEVNALWLVFNAILYPVMAEANETITKLSYLHLLSNFIGVEINISPYDDQVIKKDSIIEFINYS